jgi:hypothetical protein
MKFNNWFVVFAIAILGFWLAGSSSAQEVPDSAKIAELMAAYQEMAKPGEEHELLESLVGTWNLKFRLWPQPGTEPMTTYGTSVNEMILGGRFLLSKSVSGEGQMETEAMSIMGFDRRHRHYTYAGYDTWGTYYVAAAGPYQADQEAIVMYGEDVDPIMGFTQKYDIVLRPVNKDKYVVEIVFKDEVNSKGTGEFKIVEIEYTRVK